MPEPPLDGRQPSDDEGEQHEERRGDAPGDEDLVHAADARADDRSGLSDRSHTRPPGFAGKPPRDPDLIPRADADRRRAARLRPSPRTRRPRRPRLRARPAARRRVGRGPFGDPGRDLRRRGVTRGDRDPARERGRDLRADRPAPGAVRPGRAGGLPDARREAGRADRRGRPRRRARGRPQPDPGDGGAVPARAPRARPARGRARASGWSGASRA